MDQYHPAYQGKDYPPLHRRLHRKEYETAIAAAESAGLHRFA